MSVDHENLYRPYRDATERLTSARKLVKLLVEADDLYPVHRRGFIKLALWTITEAEAPKYKVRFRSRDSLVPGALLRHDHVYERAKMADALIANPNRADEILDLAIGCVVTKEEHRLLSDLSRRNPDLDGWRRYVDAGIVVFDMKTREQVDLHGLVNGSSLE